MRSKATVIVTRRDARQSLGHRANTRRRDMASSQNRPNQSPRAESPSNQTIGLADTTFPSVCPSCHRRSSNSHQSQPRELVQPLLRLASPSHFGQDQPRARAKVAVGLGGQWRIAPLQRQASAVSDPISRAARSSLGFRSSSLSAPSPHSRRRTTSCRFISTISPLEVCRRRWDCTSEAKSQRGETTRATARFARLLPWRDCFSRPPHLRFCWR